MPHYLKNTKTGREFKIIQINEAEGTVELQGQFSKFTEPFDKKRFKENGYTLVEHEDVKEEEDAE